MAIWSTCWSNILLPSWQERWKIFRGFCSSSVAVGRCINNGKEFKTATVIRQLVCILNCRELLCIYMYWLEVYLKIYLNLESRLIWALFHHPWRKVKKILVMPGGGMLGGEDNWEVQSIHHPCILLNYHLLLTEQRCDSTIIIIPQFILSTAYLYQYRSSKWW